MDSRDRFRLGFAIEGGRFLDGGDATARGACAAGEVFVP